MQALVLEKTNHLRHDHGGDAEGVVALVAGAEDDCRGLISAEEWLMP
jgi:hypothetical protein